MASYIFSYNRVQDLKISKAKYYSFNFYINSQSMVLFSYCFENGRVMSCFIASSSHSLLFYIIQANCPFVLESKLTVFIFITSQIIIILNIKNVNLKFAHHNNNNNNLFMHNAMVAGYEDISFPQNVRGKKRSKSNVATAIEKIRYLQFFQCNHYIHYLEVNLKYCQL